ncbi:helix-turn-helix domain-containing protein [Marinibaculum pumilum]|uniref:Helix-turn-helix domain-containing protein n=1 Tax=Marinibaculum pumilum TaxID=1766165 RepID=A0ABV7KYC5_9PROT
MFAIHIVRMHPVQLKLARNALGLSMMKLSEETGIATSTILRFENTGNARLSTAQKLQRFFETSGIEFIERDGKPGILVGKPASS